MAIAQAMCTSFKQELLQAEHDFDNGAHTFRIALYTQTSDTSLSATTTVYITANEVSESGTNYTAKGFALTNVTPTAISTTAIADFSPDATWTTATFTARGALIFNDSHASDAAVLVLDFGADKTATAGTFTVAFPAADASNAIIRIA